MTKEKSFYEEYRKELLAKGMEECPECHFVQQYKGQKNSHYYTCSVIQNRWINPSKRSG